MYKDYRYINAGENEFYRWGKKAQERIAAHLTPNEKGFYSIPADGEAYYTIGTSNGKFGEFAKFHDTFLSVNSMGCVWAKECGVPCSTLSAWEQGARQPKLDNLFVIARKFNLPTDFII